MKTRLLIALCCFALILSCDPLVLENNTRVLVKGSVQDSNGMPIANAEILVYAKKGSGIPTTAEIDKNMLGSNVSDAQGNFSVTSILARDDEFTVEVKSSNEFSLYVYQTNTEEYIPSDLIFNIPTITLSKLSTVDFNIAKTSSEENTLQYNFRYVADFCFEVYDEEELDVNESLCPFEEGFGQNLNLDNPNASGDFIAPLGSIVQFNYSLNGEPTQTETFTLNQDTYNFEFNY